MKRLDADRIFYLSECYSDPRINQKIISDLNFIKDTLVSRFGDKIIALILTGGFGRGEGGILIHKNQIRVANDYDLIMVVKSHIDTNRVDALSKSLAHRLGLKWVDIDVISVSKLKKLRGTQYGYDLKRGSFILYGDPTILEKMSETRPEDISPSQIEVLLLNRIWCFLGSIKQEFFCRELTSEEKFFLFQQLSKAILALEDSWLIQNRQYVCNYREKLEKFSRISGDVGLLKLAKWATESKLKPSYNFPPYQPIEFYFKVKDVFMKEMLTIINNTYRKNFRTWTEYISWYPRRLDVLIRRVGYLFLKKSMKYEKYLNLKMSQLALVNAFHASYIDVSSLTLSKKRIKKIGNYQIPESEGYLSEWWNLKRLTLELNELYGK